MVNCILKYCILVASSVVGRGSQQFHTGTPIAVNFTDTLESSRYASTALFGGEAMNSEFGKSFVGKMTGQYTGNDGICDTDEGNKCAMSTVNIVIVNHSHIRHGSDALKALALRKELLACCSDGIWAKVAAYPKEGSWLGLRQHFLQTCGSQNIRAADTKMLTEAQAERPLRTLRQRVTALILPWYTAQETFYGAQPEFDDFGNMLKSCQCSPSISIHDQNDALKELVMNTDKSLWQMYSNRPEYRTTKENHVPLLHVILALNQEALLLLVESPKSGTSQLRVGNNRSEVFNTSGDPTAQMVTISLHHAKGMESRAIAGDSLVGNNRLVHDQGRVRGVSHADVRLPRGQRLQGGHSAHA